jgi:hypothetical protein
MNEGRKEGHLDWSHLAYELFSKHAIEGKIEGRIEVTGRQGRRRKQLLDDLKETRKYWEFREEVLDRVLWEIRFGTVRQTT